MASTISPIEISELLLIGLVSAATPAWVKIVRKLTPRQQAIPVSKGAFVPNDTSVIFRDASGSCHDYQADRFGYWAPTIAVTSPGLAVICSFLFPAAHAFAGTLLGMGLLALMITDTRHYLLPNILTGGLFVIGLCFILWIDPGGAPVHAISGAVGFAIIAGVAALYERWRGLDGLGGGDAKFVAVAGVWLGPAAIGPVLFLSATFALGTLVLFTLNGRPVDRHTVVPFGAFLSPVIFAFWCAQSLTI